MHVTVRQLLSNIKELMDQEGGQHGATVQQYMKYIEISYRSYILSSKEIGKQYFCVTDK